MWIENYSESEGEAVMKKFGCVSDIFVIVFVGLAFFSLGLPLFVTTVTGEVESTKLAVKGLEMFSFSPWGYVVAFVPAALLAVMKLQEKLPYKYPLVLLLVFIGLFGHNAGVLAEKEWIYGVATGFVRTMGGNLFLYPAFLVSAGFMLMLHMNDEDLFLDDDWCDDEDEWDPSMEEVGEKR